MSQSSALKTQWELFAWYYFSGKGLWVTPTTQHSIVRTDTDDTAQRALCARIQQLSPEISFIIILSWSKGFISSNSWMGKWESYETEKTANDGIWILTTISKRFYLVPGSKKRIEIANPGGWMDGNSWGVATRVVREYALLISGMHWSITSWFQRSALPLPVSWICV